MDQKGNDPNSANWRTRIFTYNSLSQLLTASNPESGALNYTYDSDGNLLTKVAPAPNQTGTSTVTTTYGYDALHRLTGKTYSNGDPAVSYFYDQLAYNGLAMSNGKGRRTGMSDAAGMTAWSYDSEGRTITERRIMFGLGKIMYYTYNLDGSLASLRYPTGRIVTYAYNAAARPLSAIDTALSLNYATEATYAPHGALTGVKNGVTGTFTGIVTANTYNKRLQPLTLSAQTPGPPLQTVISLTYDFHLGANNNGNVYGITNGLDGIRPNRSNGSAVYTYDQLNRITSAHTPGTTPDCTVMPSGLTKDWGQTFTVDVWSNLTNIAVERCSTPILNEAVNAKNQFVGANRYDFAGNQWENGQYVFDAENRLAATAGVTYTYDGDGKRVKKSSGTIYWTGIGSDSLVESDLSGNVNKEFIFFGGRRIARLSASAVHYYFSDHLGSHSVVTSANGGTIEQESDYYPFGGERPITTGPSNYKFTSKERDFESGLDYFGARHYASALGRFTSPDTPFADQQPDDPQSWNLYGYVRNGPLALVDPSGRGAVSAILKLARKAAVKLAWAQERQLVRRTGKGTIRWTEKQRAELLKTGKVEGFEGHHINSVKGHPDMAADPNNVGFVKGRKGQLEAHGGNFRNETSGPLLDRSGGLSAVLVFFGTFDNKMSEYAYQSPLLSDPNSYWSYVNPFNSLVENAALLEAFVAAGKDNEANDGKGNHKDQGKKGKQTKFSVCDECEIKLPEAIERPDHPRP